jgi:hypothetical protein
MPMKEHEAILQRVARECFRPAGLIQKGRSRVWFDDQGWWVTMVELQPSGWDRGSYLNVGVMWLVYPYDHAAFCDGYRQAPFVGFQEPAQFEAAVRQLCTKALELVSANRARLQTFADAHTRQEDLLSERPGALWDLYFAAVFARLCGQHQRADALANRLASFQGTHEWEVNLQRVGLETLRSAQPMAIVDAHVRHSRLTLKLAPRPLAPPPGG